eukprot:scaffold5744_cov187-Skeletonema_menzelii.AAC.2
MANPPPPTAQPSGAMSLLDKYASINSSIEDARRRVASTRANADAIKVKIETLTENCVEMTNATNDANADAAKLKEELNKHTAEQREKVAEKNRVEREKNMAKCVYNDTKNLIEDERTAFLERCREFRASCQKIRAAASILVLDGGGGNFDARDATDEIDLWRKLQEEDLSDDEEGMSSTSSNARKREHKKIDTEMEQAEMKEKESRQNHIEAECGLSRTRSEHETATKRCSSRRVKLTQQRAQLERHRKEVSELEREIAVIKNDVVEANQMAKTFEKGENITDSGRELLSSSTNLTLTSLFFSPECQRRKQIRSANVQASYSNNFNPAPQESSISNPYRRNSQTTSSVPVSNPYNRAITPNATSNNSTTNNHYRSRNGNGGASSSHRYASDLMNEVTPHPYGNNYSTQRNKAHQQQVQGGSRVSRHNRQFGTNIGVSTDSEMTDELRECMAAFSTDNNSDDLSVSSNSSSDDEILSFNIFGKK